MSGAEVRDLMETMLPDALLAEVAEETGVHQRERKRNAVKFLRTMLSAAASPAGGRQADIMRHYFEMGAPRVVRGSFYDWFGPPLEATMAKLSEIVMTRARAQPVDLPGILAGARDWRIVDSETVALDDRLLAEEAMITGEEVKALIATTPDSIDVPALAPLRPDLAAYDVLLTEVAA